MKNNDLFQQEIDTRLNNDIWDKRMANRINAELSTEKKTSWYIQLMPLPVLALSIFAVFFVINMQQPPPTPEEFENLMGLGENEIILLASEFDFE